MNVVTTAPAWRKCSDELPELGDYAVLAYWADGGIDMVHVEDQFRDITNGLDAAGKQLYTKWYLTSGITHWMPLPEPPVVAHTAAQRGEGVSGG